MGQKKAPAKKSDEEKAAEKKLKANESMLKACKDDELKKVEEAVGKGAHVGRRALTTRLELAEEPACRRFQ